MVYLLILALGVLAAHSQPTPVSVHVAAPSTAQPARIVDSVPVVVSSSRCSIGSYTDGACLAREQARQMMLIQDEPKFRALLEATWPQN